MGRMKLILLEIKEKEQQSDLTLKENIHKMLSNIGIQITQKCESDYFPKKVREQRKTLIAHLKTARKNGYSAFTNYDKLIIDGKNFTFQQLEEKVSKKKPNQIEEDELQDEEIRQHRKDQKKLKTSKTTPHHKKKMAQRQPADLFDWYTVIGEEVKGYCLHLAISFNNYVRDTCFDLKVNRYITIILHINCYNDALNWKVENKDFYAIKSSVNNLNSKIRPFLSLERLIIVLVLVKMPPFMQRDHWVLLIWISGNIIS
ncbi:hypothetical protein FQA39_LY08319 [Lamprigera yunnana]|nr:hypothetical protein FQA39_LY08319 [Lamprigera yunnana]